MRRGSAVLLASACVVGVSAHGLSATSSWVPYQNAIYGFRLLYPAAVLAPERTSPDGRTQLFTSRSRAARLLVGARENRDGQSIASLSARIEHEHYRSFRVTYRHVGDGWMVLSGLDGERIFYEKAILSRGARLITSFALVYPVAERAVFDRVVEGIERSFVPGRQCEPADAGFGDREDR